MLYEYLKSIDALLKADIQKLAQELEGFPTQNLLANKNGKYKKYYICNGAHPIYVHKKELPLAQTLALKKFKTLQYEEKCCEQALLKDFLSACQKQKKKSLELLQADSLYSELLQTRLQALCPKNQDWASADYLRNPNHPEHLIHQTLSGHPVRSKSEVIIANALFLNQIPYRYECALQLNDATIYPDFTILHPATSSLWYWEHFGMMDNASYRDLAYNKLKLYGNHDIIPSVNLITTYETRTHPANSEEIDHLIKRYFVI
ncbi:MAG: hypothetical protein PHV18_07920 [Lachnospiraceae bacterium]|nr:hypothetical protein [Lachnospiraceae bacterium]